MAPEMMKGKKYDEKVDIFSFGIVLCEVIIFLLINGLEYIYKTTTVWYCDLNSLVFNFD